MGCGPLLIAKTHIKPEELSSKTIAIPGEKTTAHFLLNSIFPDIKNKKKFYFLKWKMPSYREKLTPD
jgi:1,4-dihydroxy-6-naphthoate synthase